MKCYNCKEDKEDEKFFKYKDRKYCYTCLREYFMDNLVEDYFDNFTYEECEGI